MFIQVIEGQTNDAKALQKRFEVWDQQIRPGAIGYLGSTGGCTSTGAFILVARFESKEAAQQNSARPEQDRWWRETMKCIEGEPTFHDTEEVHLMQHGDLSSARFVQVLDGHVTDRARAIDLEEAADPVLEKARPDLLGSVLAFHGDDAFTELAYFTSEAEARKGEQAPMPAEASEQLADWQSVMQVDRYLDLAEPWTVQA